MNNDIEKLVDDVWQSADRVRRAIELGRDLSPESKALLERLLLRLKASASAKSLQHQNIIEWTKNGDASPVKKPEVALILLLTFAIHHSDTLTYLPRNIRTDQVLEWSNLTGLVPEIIWEAVMLGPVGLKTLIQSA